MGRILYLMQIRLLEGLYFFQESIGKNADNKQTSRDLLKRYFYASEIIQKEFEKTKVQKREELVKWGDFLSIRQKIWET